MLDAIARVVALVGAVRAHRALRIRLDHGHRGLGGLGTRLRSRADAAGSGLPGAREARDALHERTLLVVGPAGIALELEPEAMHGDADLLVHLADQALDLVDPRGALLGLAAPAQAPVARARDQEQHRGPLVPAPAVRLLDLRSERAAVRLCDGAVGEGLEQEPERGVAGPRAGGAGLQEL